MFCHRNHANIMKATHAFYLIVLLSLTLLHQSNSYSNYLDFSWKGVSTSSSQLYAQLPPSRKAPYSSQTSTQLSPNVEKYLQMKELRRMRDNGASYDELKQAIVNGTLKTATKSKAVQAGYQRYVGKGSLDQRLRNIISYKRSVVADQVLADISNLESWSKTDENELMTLMENDDEDNQELEEEDEEAQYESLVLNALEQNKLNQIKSNMQLSLILDETNHRNQKIELEHEATFQTVQQNVEILVTSPTSFVNSTTEIIQTAQDEDLYRPAVSTWGVYERPRDISKAYGGGRSISKEEMDRMDEDLDDETTMTASERLAAGILKLEVENEKEIRQAIEKAQAELRRGRRKEAVQQFENVLNFVSWQSDFGGDFYLQYGMALETVDRSDDARKIYGKLVTTSWSQKVRRLALQLISGLDISKQIRKDVGPHKPILDYTQMGMIHRTLEQSVPDELRPQEQNRDKYLPWYGEESESDEPKTSYKVHTIQDAYSVLVREINPLFEVPSRSLLRAFQKFYYSTKNEREIFYKNDRPVSVRLNLLSSSALNKNKPSLKAFPDINSMINGTWELVSSMFDAKEDKLRRYDSGSLRLTFNANELSAKEVFPTVWGMYSASRLSTYSIDSHLQELIFFGEDLRHSKAPWQRNRQSKQNIQVR